nr:uncharacterized protein LOC117681522 isoform X2 [Crassostrea gigas]
MDLHQRWLSTAIDVLKISGDLPQKWWGVIEGRYSEKQRHYHTLRHLEEMFQHFDKYFKKLNQPELVVLAIFFHDIIYDPKANDNEEESAEVFSQFSKEAGNLEADKTDAVMKWILQTKSHSVKENSDKDLQFFLDMDMAVLGRPSEVFFQTTRSMQIRFVKNTAIYLIRNTKSADQRFCGAFVSDRGYLLPTSFTKCTMTSPFKI